MTMTFSLREDFSFRGDVGDIYEINYTSSSAAKLPEPTGVHLAADKLSVPKFKHYIKRPRLNNLLEKSLTRFGAAIVTGRAGTGKSALAANFARQYKRVSWFSIKAADSDWNVFSGYFQSLFDDSNLEKSDFHSSDESDIAPFIENLLQNLPAPTKKPLLLVLDDVHNVFDAAWFADFFTFLLLSLTADVHLLMLSRSNPPLPLWRLRSKQILGVVDEKLLAFNPEETKKLFKKYGLSEEHSLSAHRKSFGRVSRLKTSAESLQIK